ncbi:hypothetical protein [Paenibacillus sp. HB172176]|uniref:hypothetical protein n=1 Tax=Paenibacillus sp. HB172176 TaxID=2493690 RepID=UPI00143CA8EE|nr:hypothetical protein [Paenibacillus sp. HB172176]
MKRRKLKGFPGMLLLMLIFVFAEGCTTDASKHTPEEWLSLSYSGLEAMDQYAFTGSTSMGLEGGVMFQPQTFEGRISNHEQLTIQSRQQGEHDWNPIEVLKTLNQSNQSVVISGEGADEASSTPILTLRVEEAPDVTKERWSARLKEELEQVAGSGREAADEGARSNRDEVLDASRQELQAMLETLVCSSVYDITIDRRRLIPLKMEEKTSFQYIRAGHAMKESRHTTVRLQDFDGSAAAEPTTGGITK